MNIGSQTFNSFQYNQVDDKDTEEERFEEIVTKDGNKIFKVDIGHFDKLCEKFRLLSDMKIKNLTGKDKDDFNLMVSYVHLLYGTSYYDKFYKKVKKHFSSLSKIIPGRKSVV